MPAQEATGSCASLEALKQCLLRAVSRPPDPERQRGTEWGIGAQTSGPFARN